LLIMTNTSVSRPWTTVLTHVFGGGPPTRPDEPRTCFPRAGAEGAAQQEKQEQRHRQQQQKDKHKHQLQKPQKPQRPQNQQKQQTQQLGCWDNLQSLTNLAAVAAHNGYTANAASNLNTIP